MNYKTLFLVSVLWLSPAFASESSYVCTQNSDEETALLGERFSLVSGEEAVVLSSDSIGQCEADEGELSGDACEVADEVSASIDETLIQGDEGGYVRTSTDDDEALYACEPQRH